MEHRNENKSRQRDRGKETVRPRRLSYEEERRRREQPWSPSRQTDIENEATLYANGGRSPQNHGGPADLSFQGGGNRGKGPKGYMRSDGRIKEVICDRMMEDDLLDASDITVEVENGEVTLTGTVPERPAKRYAEELTEEVAGCPERAKQYSRCTFSLSPASCRQVGMKRKKASAETRRL